MNLCMFSGNLTRDPEINFIQNSGTNVVNFSIAINRHYKSRDGVSKTETTFVDCEAWDTGAETIAKHFKKGSPIEVVCVAKNNRWEDKDGNKRSALRFRVERFSFPPKGGSAPESNGESEGEVPVGAGVGEESEIPF